MLSVEYAGLCQFTFQHSPSKGILILVIWRLNSGKQKLHVSIVIVAPLRREGVYG
jgi:hypothetical protein